MPTREILARLDTINPAGPPAGCTVILRNSTMPEREATIVAAGVHFYYSDEQGESQGDYMAGPVRVALAAGATAPFRSADPRRTVRSLAAVIRVRFGDQDSPKAKEYDYVFEWNDKELLMNPPVRHFLVEIRIEFKVVNAVRFTPGSAQQWFELREAP